MEIVKKPLSELRPSEKNIRKHGAAQIAEFKRSIKMFGVIRPIICDESGNILAGHGLYEALVGMGKEEADCIVMKGLSEADKYKLMLADNKIYSLGIDNYQSIDEIMKTLALDSDFDIPGYDANTLDDLYGIRSVEKSAVEMKKPDPEVFHAAEPFTPQPDPSPSPSVVAAREEAKAAANKYIICPYCGERIEIE